MKQIGKILTGLFAVIGFAALVYTFSVNVVVDRFCQMEVLGKVRSPDGARAIVHVIQSCSEKGTIEHALSVGGVIGIINNESKVVRFWEMKAQDSSLWDLQYPVLKIRWELPEEIVVLYPPNMDKPHVPDTLGGVKIFLKPYE